MGCVYPKLICRTVFRSKALTRALDLMEPRFWALSEIELEQKFRVTPVMIKLKLQYWQLVACEGSLINPLSLTRLFEGICTYTNFYNQILFNPHKLVWILTPFADTRTHLQRLQMIALRRVSNILESDQLETGVHLDLLAAVAFADFKL